MSSPSGQNNYIISLTKCFKVTDTYIKDKKGIEQLQNIKLVTLLSGSNPICAQNVDLLSTEYSQDICNVCDCSCSISFLQ